MFNIKTLKKKKNCLQGITCVVYTFVVVVHQKFSEVTKVSFNELEVSTWDAVVIMSATHWAVIWIFGRLFPLLEFLEVNF